MSIGNGEWKLWREGEPFSQRFIATFNDGNTITGRWESPKTAPTTAPTSTSSTPAGSTPNAGSERCVNAWLGRLRDDDEMGRRRDPRDTSSDLRSFRGDDLARYAALNADPEVARWLGGPITRSHSDSIAEWAQECYEREGIGLLAVERTDDGAFLGMCGLHHQSSYPDDVEVAWRLAREHWGKGYATEAATACLDHGFGKLGLPLIIRTRLTRRQERDHMTLSVDLIRQREEAPGYAGTNAASNISPSLVTSGATYPR
jgi:RimJ/RimL family protein N-acetyltransferase